MDFDRSATTNPAKLRSHDRPVALTRHLFGVIAARGTDRYKLPMDSSNQGSSTDEGHAVAFGEWRLDTLPRHLIDQHGRVTPLSGAEYRLLCAFLDRPRRILTRDQLLDFTRGRDADSFDRSIDLLVSRLRKKLRDPARAPRHIKTIRNEGYCFYPDVRSTGATRR